jgi:hypothetical protein
MAAASRKQNVSALDVVTGRSSMSTRRRHAPRRVRLSLMAVGLPLVALLLLAAPPAHAGGDFVDLAAGSTHLWFVGPPGVRELDARTGRTVARPPLVGAAYPLSVTLAGGATWGACPRFCVRGGC